MDQSSRERLTTFVDKAAKVERSPYFKHLQEQGGTKLTFNWEEGVGGGFTANFPDEGAIDAIVLTGRMFVQNNDQISFGNLAKLENDAGISEEWKDRFRDTRDRLNTFLDAPSIIREENGNGYTYRQIFDTFVYGGLAHTGKAHEVTFNAWKGGLGFPIFESEFHRVLMALLDAVYQARLFSELELKGQPIPPFED